MPNDTGAASRPQLPVQPLKLLTPDDVAALISVERVTVIRLARAGKIPSLKIGKVIRFRPSTIEAWMAEQESA